MEQAAILLRIVLGCPNERNGLAEAHRPRAYHVLGAPEGVRRMFRMESGSAFAKYTIPGN
ncbi:MAG: hypothetical protein HZB26_15325 [Candidatus Hydrogenedentes bacterium]|nr:hypothetical protein [Candidatus Hydrogenedentota bacterium]